MTLCSYNIFDKMASTQQKETILEFAKRVVRVEGKSICWEDQTRDLVHVIQLVDDGAVVHRERPLEWVNDVMPVSIRMILESWPASQSKRTCLCCSQSFTSAGAVEREID